MKNPHFYKAKSRLGCTSKLYKQSLRAKALKQSLKTTFQAEAFKIIYKADPKTRANHGVEKSPDRVITTNFLKNFPTFQISSFIFPSPEKVDKNQLFSVISQFMEKFTDQINHNLRVGQTPVLIGGDHSLTFASLNALLKRVSDPKEIGYIQFDSHGDMNLFSSSPSKNFHGMYLRPFIGDFDIPQITQIVSKKLPPENMLFIGNLDLDREETIFFQSQKIANIDGAFLQHNLVSALNQVKEMVRRFSFLHVTIDMDVFDQSEAPATGIPAQNGLRKKQLLPLLKAACQHPRLSLDVVEVNPQLKGGPQTISLAQEIILKALRD